MKNWDMYNLNALIKMNHVIIVREGRGHLAKMCRSIAFRDKNNEFHDIVTFKNKRIYIKMNKNETLKKLKVKEIFRKDRRTTSLSSRKIS